MGVRRLMGVEIGGRLASLKMIGRRLGVRRRAGTRAGTGTMAANQWLRAQAAERQNASLMRLDQASRVVYSLAEAEALDRLATIARELVDAALCVLVVHSPGSLEIDSISICARVGIPTEGIASFMAALSGRVDTASRRSESLPGIDEETEAPGVPVLGATLLQPLMAGTDKLGFVVVCRTGDRGPLDDVDDALVHQVGQHAVTVVEKARKERERGLLLTELADKNDQLERANRLKSQFLSNMSHELRTPLSAVIGFSELILDGADGELTHELHDDVAQIHASARSLLVLINDILDLSKIEAGRMDIEIELRALEPIVAEVLATVRPLAESKHLRLEATYSSPGMTIRCDHVRTRQVITNLVSNALKFTGEGGVTIECELVEDRVMISVIDTGLGIPDEAQEKIWDAFVQAESTTSRRFGGTGLGLSISRKLVEMMGGQIGLVSNPGRGSRFWFTIPSGPPAAAGPASEGMEVAGDSSHAAPLARPAAEGSRAEPATPQLDAEAAQA